MLTQKKSGAGSRLVRDIMTRDPECLTEKDSVVEAARIMKREDTGVVPIVDDNRKLVGMITDRDIVVRLLGDGRNPLDCKVSEAMSKSVRSVGEDSMVDEVLSVMRSANVRRVPVCDKSGRVVGIVSMADLATESGEKGKVGDVVQDISEARPNN
ncbi:MAG TPA: CBS domain-containing protein [Thermoanaerobaculia bacterium]|nr:CBS domain-containing protein [Thermoanaerobaculia bacterium]